MPAAPVIMTVIFKYLYSNEIGTKGSCFYKKLFLPLWKYATKVSWLKKKKGKELEGGER